MAEEASALDESMKNLKIKKDHINILLLGETGVGKSTFINAIANYLTYFSDFEEVEKNSKLDILIPCLINVVDKHGINRKLQVGTTDQNEVIKVGESATQDVKTYVFPIANYKIHARLIDTPGMGDTRGIQQDDVNSENILSYISNLEELHAICFLFRSDLSRSTVFFQYCIAQIFSRLDKSASNNIIFVFTGTRGANYGPGDTISILRKTVDDIRNRPPYVQIPIGRNVFCFENESFKYLAAIKEKVEFSKEYKENCKESWRKSSSECFRLINYIVGDAVNKPLEPHFVKSTNAINEARRMITHMAQPLADISELINHNMDVLQRHENHLKMDNLSLTELKKKLYMPVISLEVIKQTQPVTVCTSRHCAEIYKVGEKNNWHYKQRCHDPCYLRNVPNEMIGSPELAHCAAIDQSTKKCIKCACDFSIHMHIYYMTKTKEDTIQDDNVAKNINSKEKLLQSKMKLIQEIRTRKDEYDREHKVIVKTCAKFAHFLQNNAITPFSDSYKAYIEYLIKRESSLGHMCNSDTVKQLQKLLREYEEAKKLFDEAKNKSGKSDVSSKEILEGIQELFKLKHNGKKIEELCKCQDKAKSKEYENTEYVHKFTLNKSDKKQKESKSYKSESDDKKSDRKSNKKSDSNQARGSDRERNSVNRDSNKNQRSTQERRGNHRNSQQYGRGSDYHQERRGHNYSNSQPYGAHPQYPNQQSYPGYAYGPGPGHAYGPGPGHAYGPGSGPGPVHYPNYDNPSQPNTFDRNAPAGYKQGYNINIEFNPNGSHSQGGHNPNFDNFHQSSGHFGSASYNNPPPYTPYSPGLNPGYGPHYSGYSSGPQGSGHYGPPESFGNHAQWHQQSGPPHAGSNQYQGGNRHHGTLRGRGNHSNSYRGGRGKRGVNKNYKSGNQNKKTSKKQSETESDSDSSTSSSSTDSWQMVNKNR